MVSGTSSLEYLSVRQEDKLVLECAAREYLRRLSVIWTSPLSDYNRVVASNQFVLPVLGYIMWTKQWPVMELKQIDREARKIVAESGGRHPCSSNALLYMTRSRGGRGLRSVDMEYKATKIKGAVRLHYQSVRLVMKIVHWEWCGSLKSKRQGWGVEWKNCPSHTIAGLVELYEQLLPTRVYTSQKTHTSGEGDVRCRLCGKAPESVAHILSGCSALAQSKYLSRHDAALKVLFYELLYDKGFIDEIPPWYSPDKPKPVYESENVKAYWDVPIFADQQEVRCIRVDARIVNHICKRVVTLEVSCPWVNNRTRKDEEKTLKYGPLRWELRQQFPDYEVKQYNIIMDALVGWSRELDVMLRELAGGRSTDVLRKMQRAVLSGTLNIARTFKVAV
ncbi:hypothetical protein AWC38_SpisGene14545 [Stylophora pistillata]|uniref:Reverse transcriptase zinc-binding domain-containing protein n=1 Tax=Stylophora pistillata TaxID=50429 RepID=A0A2B4RW29_STYPI|nr:hypothetical protein AWC38_SpisGene14545 [Stylophora pistillata]